MKTFYQAVTAILLFITSVAHAQSGGQMIPELIFKNPVLVSGTDKANGAVYKYVNVATGIDATVTILGRSSNAVVLQDIDASTTGWSKAFQPQLGIDGNVPAYQNWWMEFEMRFFKTGTTDRYSIKGFKVTAIDIDGDGSTIQEYLQMNKVSSVSYSIINYLTETIAAEPLSLFDNVSNNLVGINKMVQGPTQNFSNIDTNGTAVMATFSYADKDMISFRFGGKSGGSISNAGIRMNSLWFKSFSLAPQTILPVALSSFTATTDKKAVTIKWTAANEINFSHYVLQKSTDGKNYTDLAVYMTDPTVTTNMNYQFKDNNMNTPSGMLYYRLKLVDNTKDFSYSEVRMIRNVRDEATLQLNAFPNPATSQVRVTLPAAWQGKKVQFDIYGSNGVAAQTTAVSNASQTEELSLSRLPKGMLVIKASCDGQVATQTLIKN